VKLTGGDAATVTTPTDATVINVTFDSGANNGKVMLLTPTATDTGQISGWTCTPGSGATGIDPSRLPASCQS